MSQLKIDFGKKLQELRRQSGLTQEELADEIELTVESVSNIERGVHGPKFDTLERLALALGVPVVALFDFNDI